MRKENNSALFDLSEDACENLLQDAMDMAVGYLANANVRPPYPTADAVSIAEGNITEFSDEPAPPRAVLAELNSVYGDATISTHSGRYFGFVHGSSFPIGLAAKWLTTIWDQNTPLYALSPAASYLEDQTEAWLVEILGLPNNSKVGFVSSTSQSLLSAAFVARDALLGRLGWDVRTKGLREAPALRVIVGEHAHNAVKRALNIAGFGAADIVIVPADNQGRMLVEAIPVLNERDIVFLQAGNIYSGAFDQFSKILPEVRKAGAWAHVDGAFGLWAAASPEKQSLIAGMDLADSWSADCHKTLNTPYSTGLIICRHGKEYTNHMSSSGTYLDFSKHRDGMDYSPDMARRFGAAEIWATLKFLGRRGLGQLIDRLCEVAQSLAAGLAADGYEVVNEVAFNQITVCLADDLATQKALRYIQESGVVWTGGGEWLGRTVIRISVSSWRTTQADVTKTLEIFRAAARQ